MKRLISPMDGVHILGNQRKPRVNASVLIALVEAQNVGTKVVLYILRMQTVQHANVCRKIGIWNR